MNAKDTECVKYQKSLDWVEVGWTQKDKERKERIVRIVMDEVK